MEGRGHRVCSLGCDVNPERDAARHGPGLGSGPGPGEQRACVGGAEKTEAAAIRPRRRGICGQQLQNRQGDGATASKNGVTHSSQRQGSEPRLYERPTRVHLLVLWARGARIEHSQRCGPWP